MNEIESLAGLVSEYIGAHEMDLGIFCTLPASDLDGRFVGIDCVDPRRDSARASQPHHLTRQIATTRAEIEHTIASVGVPPAIEKAAQEPVAPSRTVDFLEIGKMLLELC